MADDEFERALAGRLGVEPEGLIQGLFAEMAPERAVIDAVAAAKRAGVRTGLVSNSWGRHAYDRSNWDALFDVTVISGELGVRKPDPEIYDHAVELLGVPPEQTAFVDDLEQNLEPARRLGMTVVHHTDPERTVAELERLFELPLRAR
jgi:putative hydrolase of the HAD superfamily